jgi:hypothetical protein
MIARIEGAAMLRSRSPHGTARNAGAQCAPVAVTGHLAGAPYRCKLGWSCEPSAKRQTRSLSIGRSVGSQACSVI